MYYEIRRPFMGGKDWWREATVVSRHRTLAGALRALRRYSDGARQQGGYSQDVVVELGPDGPRLLSY
jgi:hypothetical protein